MNVAFVHDYLTEYGGAERVLEAMLELWPSSPVFASLYDKKVSLGKISPTLVTALSPAPPILAKVLTPIMPCLFENLDLRSFDVIISNGTIWSKSVLTTPDQLHIFYCHTPPRFLYHYPGETDRRKIPFLRPFLAHLDLLLRNWDFETAQRPDFIIANSQTTAKRIEKFWRREAMVIYPPVQIGERAVPEKSTVQSRAENLEDSEEFVRDGTLSDGESLIRARNQPSRLFEGDAQRADQYFLIVSRLSAYKNVDLAIKACNELNLPLKIVGTGREERRLKSLAGPSVEFFGFVDDNRLTNLYCDCQAVIAPAQDEDFGIVPVEAMSYGKSVIALRSGGHTETIIEGETGTFFDQPTVESLTEALSHFDPSHFQPDDCKKQAAQFSKERFQKEFKEFVEKAWGDKMNAHARTSRS